MWSCFLCTILIATGESWTHQRVSRPRSGSSCQPKSLSPRAEVKAEPAAGFWELDCVLATSLLVVMLFNLRAVSFYLRAKPGSTVIPEQGGGQERFMFLV